jgi:3-deoxy-manno-octulosonate cytidylyltransferase (CMP-KDO synthetase)
LSHPLLVIPARMASARLPGKPLAMIGDAPMIVQVWRRAVEAKLGPVIVACAEPEIAAAIRQAGGEAMMTRPDHPSGSDRIFEAVSIFDLSGRHDVIVNVQGDLPLIDSKAIQASLLPLAEPSVDIATLAAPIHDEAERQSPNVVKIAAGFAPGAQIARALYFSRAAVPHGAGLHYHHIGLYAYRRAALERFVKLPPSVLEKRESLEQLRALDAGMRIDVALVDSVPFGVDTPDDLARARELMAARSPQKS